jgi:methionyl-tRNA formyltransferase
LNVNIVLFINGSLGLKVLDHVTGLKNHKLVSVFVNSDDKRTSDYIVEVRSLLSKKSLQPLISSWDGEHSQFEKLGIDFKLPTFGVSALFGHAIPEEMIQKFSPGIINLHPSLLPIGRGADPIPWSIVNCQKQGISLHLINQGLDTGDIVFQKEISTTIDMNAGHIYDKAVAELFAEFSRILPKWLNGEVMTYPQSGVNISSHRSSEFGSISIINESEIGTFGDFVRRLQAATFTDGRRPTFKDDVGKIWEVTFSISDLHRN